MLVLFLWARRLVVLQSVSMCSRWYDALRERPVGQGRRAVLCSAVFVYVRTRSERACACKLEVEGEREKEGGTYVLKTLLC